MVYLSEAGEEESRSWGATASSRNHKADSFNNTRARREPGEGIPGSRFVMRETIRNTEREDELRAMQKPPFALKNQREEEPDRTMKYGHKWEKLRARVLRRDGYQSQIAKRYGKHVEADTVHHILPVEHFPEYMFTPWNLISITAAEHNRLHERETHKLTDEGLDLARRTAMRLGLNLPDIMARLEPKDTDEAAEGYEDEEE